MSKLKILKLIVSFNIILVLAFIFSCSYAVDLNIVDDLTSAFPSNNSTNSNSTDTSNTNTSTISDDTTTSYSSNSTTNGNSVVNNTYTPSANVSNILPESDLELSTILNVLLIVIGILLILLAIAILVRLKR